MPLVRLALIATLLIPAACGSPEEPVPERVTGLIVEIGREAGRIDSITVETREERRFDIAIDPNRDYGFDLEHLEEHRLQQLPVAVRIEERGGTLYATEILDA
jgi:hypothetical protein